MNKQTLVHSISPGPLHSRTPALPQSLRSLPCSHAPGLLSEGLTPTLTPGLDCVTEGCPLELTRLEPHAWTIPHSPTHLLLPAGGNTAPL